MIREQVEASRTEELSLPARVKGILKDRVGEACPWQRAKTAVAL